MPEFLVSIADWIIGTQVPEQIKVVDVKGLFKNAYFLVPFISLILYYLYKQAINNLVIMALVITLWWFSGTSFVQGAVVDGELQLSKILPIIGIGLGSVGVIIYLAFIRSD